MAKNDVRVLKHAGPVRQYVVEDRGTSSEHPFYFGELIGVGAVANNYVSHFCDGEPVLLSKEFIGISKNDSDETQSANGTIDVYTIIPGATVLRAKATTSTNINTEAKLYALKMDWITFDVSATLVETLDENEGSDPDSHGFKILGGDIIKGTLDVLVHSMISEAGPYNS